MSDETLNSEAAAPAPDTAVTATTEVADTGTPGDAESQEPKTFTQEELDRIVSAEKAKAERKARREMTQAAENAQRRVSQTPPNPDNFEDVESYADALALHKAEELIARRDQQKQRTEVESTYADREEDARTKYSDFERVVYRDPADGGPAISDVMAEAIKSSDIGPELAYHLGKNPEESLRIYHLSPLAQARELGKIEASLSANPPVKRTSSAPAPISPVGSRSSLPAYNTSDPRSTKMSDSEWINQRNNELRAKG